MEPQYPVADPQSLRLAMRHWVAGVTVVTSVHQGVVHGMTVSSFTSISLIPPMILVSMDRASRTRALVSASGFFAVTILAREHEMLSERFAGRLGLDGERLEGLELETLVSGAPFIRGGLAYFDCRVASTQEAGTSTVFFGEVMAARSLPDGDPLVYSNRTYYRLQP